MHIKNKNEINIGFKPDLSGSINPISYSNLFKSPPSYFYYYALNERKKFILKEKKPLSSS